MTDDLSRNSIPDNDISTDTENDDMENVPRGTFSDDDASQDNNSDDMYQCDEIIPETAPYHINYEMYAEAYKSYQKHFIFPKNRIMQLVLLLLAVDFGYHGAVNPDNKLAFFLLALCVAMIFMLWYNPRKIRRSVMDVIREMDKEEYTFSMNTEKMTIRTVPAESIQDVPSEEISFQPPTEIYYSKDIFVLEKYEFFLICRGKQVFYVLPKYALYDDQAEKMRCCFEEKLGRHFRSKF